MWTGNYYTAFILYLVSRQCPIYRPFEINCKSKVNGINHILTHLQTVHNSIQMYSSFTDRSMHPCCHLSSPERTTSHKLHIFSLCNTNYCTFVLNFETSFYQLSLKAPAKKSVRYCTVQLVYFLWNIHSNFSTQLIMRTPPQKKKKTKPVLL